jgi:hypothetical protein
MAAMPKRLGWFVLLYAGVAAPPRLDRRALTGQPALS